MIKFLIKIAFIFFISNFYCQQYFFGDNQLRYILEKNIYSNSNTHHTISQPYLISSFNKDLFQKGIWEYGAIKDTSKFTFLPFLSLNQAPILSSLKLNYAAGVQFNFKSSKLSSQLRLGYQAGFGNNLNQNYSNDLLLVPSIGYVDDSSKISYNKPIFQGLISYKINKYIILSGGSEKNKFGDGYRSLWLSEFAPIYPFLKLESTFWKVKYVNLWSMHDDRHSTGFSNKKWASSHLLSYNVNKWLNLSLFESVVWQDKDTLINRGPDINYFNPFIFFRPVEYGIGSADNSLIGAGLKLTINQYFITYSNFILDEFLLSGLRNRTGWWGNKYGLQFGFKMFDILNQEGLYSNVEYNSVRPYTYSHMSSKQNYGHKNHSLAHPLQSNFKEFLIVLGYQKNNLDFSFQYHNQLFGIDSSGINFGGNMFNSYVDRNGDYAQYTGQGNLVRQNIFIAQFSYLIVPSTNTKLYLQLNIRRSKDINDFPKDYNMVNFGVSSRLWQNQKDY